MAGGELVHRLAQAHDLVLEFRQGCRRRHDLVDARLEAAGQIHAHAGDDAAVGAGLNRPRLRQLLLALADILDRVADIGGGGTRSPAGLPGGGDLLAELRHPALDVAEPLGHLLHRRRLERAVDSGLDLREAPRLDVLHAAALLAEGAVETFEAVDQGGKAVPVRLGDGAGPDGRPLQIGPDLGPGRGRGQLLGPVTAALAAGAGRSGLGLRHHGGDPRFQRNARPCRNVPRGIEHFGIETVELRHRGAGHRWPIVGSSASIPVRGARIADRYPGNAHVGSVEGDN